MTTNIYDEDQLKKAEPAPKKSTTSDELVDMVVSICAHMCRTGMILFAALFIIAVVVRGCEVVSNALSLDGACGYEFGAVYNIPCGDLVEDEGYYRDTKYYYSVNTTVSDPIHGMKDVTLCLTPKTKQIYKIILKGTCFNQDELKKSLTRKYGNPEKSYVNRDGYSKRVKGCHIYMSSLGTHTILTYTSRKYERKLEKESKQISKQKVSNAKQYDLL